MPASPISQRISRKANHPVRLFLSRGVRIGLAVLGMLLSAASTPVSAESADDAARLYSFKEPHMGTEFTLRVWTQQGRVEELTPLTRKAFDRVAELNRICSDYLPESELNEFARAPSGEPIPVSRELFTLFSLGLELARRTDGAFDPTAGPLVRLWRLSRKNRSLPTPDQIARARARTGPHLLELDPLERTIVKRADGMLFDLGGIAKGYAADEALEILKEGGFPRALVAASGDIAAGDPPPGEPGWRVGVETLRAAEDAESMQTVLLANRAISTSGDRRQFVEIEGTRYSHIVSPDTGLGLTERIGATVIAPDATTTDSHATAVTVMGRKEGLKFIENQREIECQIAVLRNGREVVERSDGFSRFEPTNEEANEGALAPP